MIIENIIKKKEIQDLSISELRLLSTELLLLANERSKGPKIKIWKVGHSTWDAIITKDFEIAKAYLLYMLSTPSEFDFVIDDQIMLESREVLESDFNDLYSSYSWEHKRAQKFIADNQ